MREHQTKLFLLLGFLIFEFLAGLTLLNKLMSQRLEGYL